MVHACDHMSWTKMFVPASTVCARVIYRIANYLNCNEPPDTLHTVIQVYYPTRLMDSIGPYAVYFSEQLNQNLFSLIWTTPKTTNSTPILS